jgi:anti-sigma factor RsiW
MSDRFTERLSEYLDASLTAAERAELDAHLASCPDCRSTLTELRQVVERARERRDLPPERDLWPAIAARIAAEAEVAAPVASPAVAPGAPSPRPRASWGEWLGRRWSFSMPQLAAAALLLVALGGATMWWTLRAAGPGGASVASGTRAPEGATLAASGGQGYDRAIAELQAVLDQGRARLDSSTVRILEQNLAAVDHAIADAQRAVAADPVNPYLRSYLASTMRRKIQLLRTASEIAAGSRT